MTTNQVFERQLTEMLYRADCPPAIELGDYQLGLLDKLRHRTLPKVQQVFALTMCGYLLVRLKT